MNARWGWNRTERFGLGNRLGQRPLRSRNEKGFWSRERFGGRFAACAPAYPADSPQPTKEEEVAQLKAYSEGLKAKLDETSKRISELEKK